ncbi:MAG: hypothetical protein ACXAB4_06725 [Candidatus Hodarchaeales archaeon]|jgi:hypothetical protein
MGKLMVFGIIILILGGLVTVGVGLVAPMYIDQMIEEGLEDALVIKEDDWDESWTFSVTTDPYGIPRVGANTQTGDEWLYNGPENAKAVPTYDSFYLYDIGNYNVTANAFSGGAPTYTEVGPIVCRQVKNKSVTVFTDETVTFKEASWYLLNATGHGASLTDYVVAWNPAYSVYVEGAGGEINLFYSLATQIINGSIYQIANDLVGSVPVGFELTYAKAQWGNLSVIDPGPAGQGAYEAAWFAKYFVPPVGVDKLNMNSTQVDSFLYHTSKNFAIAENVTALGAFHQSYAALNQTWQAVYGLTETQVIMLGSYLDQLILPQVVPGYMYENGFSYVANRTIYEWLFLYFDPLQYADDPTGYEPAGIFDNSSALGDPLRQNTGAKDIDKIWNEDLSYGYDNFIPGMNSYWLTLEEVAGTDATHWAPDVGKEDTLLVWNTDTMRQLDFTYVEDGEVRGIDTLRFHLDPNEFAVNTNYHQNIAGFANMSLWAGAPIYLSQPHFQERTAAEDVPDHYDIIVDVEPNTGAVLKGNKRLQFNVQLFNFSYYHTATKGAHWYSGSNNAEMYLEPLGWLDRSATADDLIQSEFDKAKNDLDELISGKELSGLASIAGLGAGLVLFAAGAAMVIIPKFAD